MRVNDDDDDNDEVVFNTEFMRVHNVRLAGLNNYLGDPRLLKQFSGLDVLPSPLLTAVPVPAIYTQSGSGEQRKMKQTASQCWTARPLLR